MAQQIDVYREIDEPDMDPGEPFYRYTVVINGKQYAAIWARSEQEAIEIALEVQDIDKAEEGS